MVAHGDHLGAVLPDTDADRLRPLRVHFPHHLADRPPVRPARAGRGPGRRGGHRPAAGLLVHEAVPGMGQLRAGDCPGPRDLRDLRRHGARGARGDAAGRRAGRRGPAGAPPVGGRPDLAFEWNICEITRP